MARRDDDPARVRFDGFDKPESNWFRMPNSWTDITAGINSIAELKIVEYILRHTWGYQEYSLKKQISIDEFVHGRRRQDGGRMDRGTGLSERAVYDGIRKAVEDGLIEEETDDSDRGRVKKFYSLRMRHEGAPENSSPPDLQDLQLGVQSLQGGVQSLPPRGANSAPRTEKDTRERQDINFEIRKVSTENVDNSGDDGGAWRPPPAPQRPPPSQSSEMTRVGDVIERHHQPATQKRRRGRPPGTGDERELVTSYLRDWAVVELGDEAPLSSSVTRTITILKTAGASVERWPDLLYQARAITKEHSAQITKKASTSGSRFATKNRMPYFLAVLEDLVGLRQGALPAFGDGEHRR